MSDKMHVFISYKKHDKATPAYATNIATPRALGCEVDCLDLDFDRGFALDVDALAARVRPTTRLISLTDRQNFSMFAIGSAEPQRRVLRMMEEVAASLQNQQGAIVVRGHTDARPYRSATYDNWRLSSARAQMAYYMLVRGGLPEKRFERVEGYADHRLRDASHPLAAENRRIEILVRDAKS